MRRLAAGGQTREVELRVGAVAGELLEFRLIGDRPTTLASSGRLVAHLIGSSACCGTLLG